MNNEKTKKIILGILMTCIMGYMYYSFYLVNEIDKIKEMQVSNTVLKSKIKSISAQKDSIDKKMVAIKNENEVIDKKIPDKYDKKELTKYFYYLIKEMNLKADMISFSEPDSKTGNYKTVTISLKVDGSQNSITDFIRTIEESKRKYVINQYNVSSKDGGLWTCNLTIETYSYN